MASDYVPRSTVVYVTEEIRSGTGTHTVQWQYDSNRNKGFVPKLGRRVGKHGPQKKAHCTESETIRAMYHKKEVSTGFLQYRKNLARQRKLGGSQSFIGKQGEALLLVAQRRREAMIIRHYTAAPEPAPVLSKLPLHANHREI